MSETKFATSRLRKVGTLNGTHKLGALSGVRVVFAVSLIHTSLVQKYPPIPP